MHLQEHVEADEVKQKISATVAGKNYSALLEFNAAQKMVHDRLLLEPEKFMKKLTIGYIRMLDEAHLAEQDKENDGQRDKTRRKDARGVTGREGKVTLWPADKANIGKWDWPSFDFPGFSAWAEGLNTENQENLINASPQSLPLTLGFRLVATNPISGFWHPGKIVVHFDRDADGEFHVDLDGITDDVLEWLASYHSRLSREHTDDELKKYAPLGAAKVYEKIKNKPITRIN
jgi:hypothetical protein